MTPLPTGNLPLISVVVSSYNYASFVGQAIESALRQAYARTEVVVVDDGSTDGSREVIGSFGSRVCAVFKSNGGQASALNAGLAASRGDVLIFLDSDDALLPDTASQVAAAFAEPGVAKVHWPLRVADAAGHPTGKVVPALPLGEGDLRDRAVRLGPGEYVWPPTSGNAWARGVLERIMPVPESVYRTCPDFYLSSLAPLFGGVRRLAAPGGIWRVHGANNTWAKPFEQTVRELARRSDDCRARAAAHLAALGVAAEPQAWGATMWWLRLAAALDDLLGAVPPGAEVVLLDDETWDAPAAVGGRRVRKFAGPDGAYLGPPADGAGAVRVLSGLVAGGATHVAFAWPTFWWLQHYPELARWLSQSLRVVLSNERLAVYQTSAATKISGERT